MCRGVAEVIGKKLGRVLQMDIDEQGEAKGSCLRIKIELDIKRPLLRGTMLGMKDGSRDWISFSYEKVSYFCFRCDIIGHRVNECHVDPEWYVDEKKGLVELFRYGPWL
ncbi:hypothetical protein Droror1_Dr00004301 [Drosera rotundifolia]